MFCGVINGRTFSGQWLLSVCEEEHGWVCQIKKGRFIILFNQEA